jgi:hypothetical protein
VADDARLRSMEVDEGDEAPTGGEPGGDIRGLEAEDSEEVTLAVSLVASPLSNAAATVVRRPGGAAVEDLFLAGSLGISLPANSCRN